MAKFDIQIALCDKPHVHKYLIIILYACFMGIIAQMHKFIKEERYIMHKKMLGMSSILMAGMLAVTGVAPAASTVYATEGATEVVAEETQEAASEAGEEKEEVAEGEEKAEEVVEGEEAAEGEEKKEESEEKKDEEKKEEGEETGETAEDEKKEDEGEVAPAKENNLVFADRWNSSATCSGVLTFDRQYQEFVYDLGQTYDTAAVKAVTLKVSDQQNNVCIKYYDEGMNELAHFYNNTGSNEYTHAPGYEGNIRFIGVMSMPEGAENYPYGITIDEVVVDAEEVAPVVNEETLVFEGENLKFTERWDGAAVEGRTLEYDKEWREYFISLGQEIPGENIKSIKFTFAEATKSLCFKVYGAGTELTQVYGQNGRAVYSYTPATTDKVDEIAIMAMNDQEYPFKVTVEKIEVVVDTTPESEKPEAGVEYDIVDLREPVAALMGDDFIIGTAASYDEFRDVNDMELVFKHFNGVTLGNELKPDAMLKKGAEIIKVELNGEEIDFPKLDFTTPESRLDLFVDWNNEHPEKQIKIRGHVLVWHSQTPDFFFHEDYDTSKPYVTPDVMNKRLEVYIREVAHHFTAEGSKYAGMFYGWDVVNEAVSDGTGTYRNANENSTWWRVYQSPEFINNAFVYANRYMPADVALFYNDYNDTTPNKVTGICQLIENVKATPGARIDGMGMQAHYQVASNSPSMEQFKTAAHRYAELVDQIQVTELDFKGSTGPKDENLAARYKAVYDTIRRLRAEGVNFTGMTIWGVTDKHSWLQTSNSVGGSADGRTRQYPLLFDDYYKAKNAFWAIAEAGELEPEIKNVTLIQNAGDDFSAGESYKFGNDDTSVTFVPMWSEGEIDVQVTVVDSTVDDADAFVIYTDDGTGIKSTTVARSEAAETQTVAGYTAVAKVAVDAQALETNKVKLDVVAVNGETKVAFGDTTLKQEESSKYFAETVIKPLLSVKKGSVAVDGDASDAAWASVKELPLSINIGANVEATAKTLWDDEKLYVLVNVKDGVLNKDSADAWQQDSLEVFIDENNAKSSSYQADDKQYRINYVNEHSFNGTKCVEENIESAAVVTNDGYVIEAAFKWTDITPEVGTKIGFELQINDADASGKRSGTLSWADKTGNGYASPEVFGTVLLVEGEEVVEPGIPTPETPVKEAELVTKYGATYLIAADGEKLTGIQTVDGVEYYFNERGVMQKSTFVTVDGKTFFATADGSLAKNTMLSRWTATYLFDEDGVMQTGFASFDGKDYYFDAKGKMVKSAWIDVENDRYYAKADGTLAKNETITKWFKKYTFDENGVLIR